MNNDILDMALRYADIKIPVMPLNRLHLIRSVSTSCFTHTCFYVSLHPRSTSKPRVLGKYPCIRRPCRCDPCFPSSWYYLRNDLCLFRIILLCFREGLDFRTRIRQKRTCHSGSLGTDRHYSRGKSGSNVSNIWPSEQTSKNSEVIQSNVDRNKGNSVFSRSGGKDRRSETDKTSTTICVRTSSSNGIIFRETTNETS